MRLPCPPPSPSLLLSLLLAIPLGAATEIMPVDNLLQWTLQGTAANAAILRKGTDRTPDREPTMEIEYAPATSPASSQFVEVVRGKVVPMPEGLRAVSFWLKGNRSGDTLSVRLIDSDRTIHQWTHAEKIDWDGWKKVRLRLDPDAPGLRSWKPGETPGPGRPLLTPLIFRSVIVQINNHAAPAGAVMIGPLHLLTKD